MQGTFQPKAKHVTVWPPPSADGDGDEVKVRDEETGEWITKKDPNGETLRHHSLPEGFKMQDARDERGTVVHQYAVKVDERGNIVRDRNDVACVLPEGGAAVVHPDGSHEAILPEKLRDFLNSHEQV